MKRVRATGGKPPVFKPTKIVKVGGVKKKFTGRGASGTGLGLHGKGRKITKKGFTGKGAYGYGQGHHGVTAPKKNPRVGSSAAGGVAAPSAARASGGGGPVKSPGGKPPMKKPPHTRGGGVATKNPKATGGKPPRRFKKSPGPGPGSPVSTKKPSGPRKSRKINRRK